MWRMADTLMRGGLEARLGELRAEGRSYDEISRVLYAEASVNISGRTIRDWCVQLDSDNQAPEPNGDPQPETKAS